MNETTAKRISRRPSRIARVLRMIYQLSILKTLYFNLRYFPLKVALRLPAFIGKNVRLKRCGGSVQLKAKPRTGMLRIGWGDRPIVDAKSVRYVWQDDGMVIFQGDFCHQHSGAMNVNQDGKCILGRGVTLNANSKIICGKMITIGNYSRISWSCQIIDTDLHDIEDMEGKIINPDSPVSIGEFVWLGSDCVVKKGVSIDSWNIIGSSSCVVKDVNGHHQIAVGTPAKIIKHDVFPSEFLEQAKKEGIEIP